MTQPMREKALSLSGDPGAAPRSTDLVTPNGDRLPVALIGAPSLCTAGVVAILALSRFKLVLQCERFEEFPTSSSVPLAICSCMSRGVDLPGLLTGLVVVRRSNPWLRILAVSHHREDRALVLAAGADAHVTTDACPQTLLGSLVFLAQATGGTLHPCETGPRGDACHAPAPPRLSAREIEVAETIARGFSNKVVARQLAIAEPTVKAHLRAILRKTGAINRTQLAVWLLQHRPVPNPPSPCAWPAAWAGAELLHDAST